MWQAELSFFYVVLNSAGSFKAQISSENGHLVLNLQPDGGKLGLVGRLTMAPPLSFLGS